MCDPINVDSQHPSDSMCMQSKTGPASFKVMAPFERKGTIKQKQGLNYYVQDSNKSLVSEKSGGNQTKFARGFYHKT